MTRLPAVLALLESMVMAAPLAPRQAPSAARFHVRASFKADALAPGALALAALDLGRIAVLFPERLALYRLESTKLVLLAERPLPAPYRAVRSPGGMIVASPDGTALWALSSRAAQAILVDIGEREISERLRADALPWPGSSEGLRYREGTNLIDGPLAGFGDGPFIALDAAAQIAVTDAGQAVPPLADIGAPRIGQALTSIGPGWLALSSGRPPGENDAILHAERLSDGLHLRSEWKVDGSIRALAFAERGQAGRLFAAVEEPERNPHLLIFELRREQ